MNCWAIFRQSISLRLCVKEGEHTMSLTVCPAAIVAAPVEVVWGNLVQWERYSEWFSADVQVERSEPEGPATVGQTISFAGKVFVITLHCVYEIIVGVKQPSVADPPRTGRRYR